MQNEFYSFLEKAKAAKRKLIAVLLDPDKLDKEIIPTKIKNIHQHQIDLIFVGGSTVENGQTQLILKEIKKHTSLPIFIFPGDFSQISEDADVLLFLSLLSGRNPEYLIEQQIKAVPLLKKSNLEIISTGYILIDGGVKTAVQRVSETKPICQTEIDKVVNTAVAGMYLGKKMIYLEAGSGAKKAVSPEIIENVSKNISIPLIVGGGIRSQKQIETAFSSGADIVVIGTAFEENDTFFEDKDLNFKNYETIR
ncbi:geranylgeranylglyceryl/heptaprenylglyceryl phosphate synthase [Aureivirga sp. CE67]|uniref:geranylgeranylglyceryl/heptaprenylglyceryl phosphate synthase n=1 Tax=Aureivirga sp. CE67 TaxID=1788983 RepID=UPI0018C94431|nr:geranylgeranylglyceryl/heptaprenylglyceryl phosphate synthase [Aureivirga sp. CE67]